MLVIKRNADIRKLMPGQQYFIDTFPDAKLENQEVTQKMLEARDKLQAAVNNHLTKLEEAARKSVVTG